jgi:hypothetical protein
MNKVISNAKIVISKVMQSASCRLEIASAVLAYTVAEYRLRRLHPVRDARKREVVGYQMRAKELELELATEKLNTI